MAAETALPRLESPAALLAPRPVRLEPPGRSDYSVRLARQVSREQGRSAPRTMPEPRTAAAAELPQPAADPPRDQHAEPTGSTGWPAANGDGSSQAAAIDDESAAASGEAEIPSPGGSDPGSQESAVRETAIPPASSVEAVTEARGAEAAEAETRVVGALSEAPIGDSTDLLASVTAPPVIPAPPWSGGSSVAVDPEPERPHGRREVILPPAAVANLFPAAEGETVEPEGIRVSQAPGAGLPTPVGFAAAVLPIRAESDGVLAVISPVDVAPAAVVPLMPSEAPDSVPEGTAPDVLPPDAAGLAGAESGLTNSLVTGIGDRGANEPAAPDPLRVENATSDEDATPEKMPAGGPSTATPTVPLPVSVASVGPVVASEGSESLQAVTGRQKRSSAVEAVDVRVELGVAACDSGARPAIPDAGADRVVEGDSNPQSEEGGAPADGSDAFKAEVVAGGESLAPEHGTAGDSDVTASDSASPSNLLVAAEVAAEPTQTSPTPVAFESVSPPAPPSVGIDQAGRPHAGGEARASAGVGAKAVEGSADELVRHAATALRAADGFDRPIRIRLTPPELGVLRIEVVRQEGRVAAQFEVTTASAQSTLNDQLSTLRDSLMRAGVAVDRIEVRLAEPAREERSQGERDRSGEGESGRQGRDGGQRDHGAEGRGRRERDLPVMADERDEAAGSPESPVSGTRSEGSRLIAARAGEPDVLDIQV